MEWLKSKKNVVLAATLVGTLGVFVTLIYIIVKDRKKMTEMENTKMAMATQAAELSNIRRAVRNIELAQCAAPHVGGNSQLAAILQCPVTNTQTSPQPMVEQSQPTTPMGGSAQPYDVHMPNYGYFGPFGTSDQQGPGMMSAFQQ